MFTCRLAMSSDEHVLKQRLFLWCLITCGLAVAMKQPCCDGLIY